MQGVRVIDQQEKRPVEYTARYATAVNSVQEAFAFVMEHLDKLGNDPSVDITPIWLVIDGENELTGEPVHVHVRLFEVSVSGSFES